MTAAGAARLASESHANTRFTCADAEERIGFAAKANRCRIATESPANTRFTCADAYLSTKSESLPNRRPNRYRIACTYQRKGV